MVRTSVLGVDVGQQQVGMPRPEAAVAADVKVPAVLGGDNAEVLALRLGALAGTPDTPALILCGERMPR